MAAMQHTFCEKLGYTPRPRYPGAMTRQAMTDGSAWPALLMCTMAEYMAPRVWVSASFAVPYSFAALLGFNQWNWVRKTSAGRQPAHSSRDA